MYENIEKQERIRMKETIWLISGFFFAITIFLAGIFELFQSVPIRGFESGNLNTILSSLVVAGVGWFIYVVFTGMMMAIVEE